VGWGCKKNPFCFCITKTLHLNEINYFAAPFQNNMPKNKPNIKLFSSSGHPKFIGQENP
jgi:hypothetical protein